MVTGSKLNVGLAVAAKDFLWYVQIKKIKQDTCGENITMAFQPRGGEEKWKAMPVCWKAIQQCRTSQLPGGTLSSGTIQVGLPHVRPYNNENLVNIEESV